jgi:hypothetical protein
MRRNKLFIILTHGVNKLHIYINFFIKSQHNIFTGLDTDTMIVPVEEILEYKHPDNQETEIHFCYGLIPQPLLKTISVDIVLPDAYKNSDELADILISSGIPKHSTESIVDSFRIKRMSQSQLEDSASNNSIQSLKSGNDNSFCENSTYVKDRRVQFLKTIDESKRQSEDRKSKERKSLERPRLEDILPEEPLLEVYKLLEVQKQKKKKSRRRLIRFYETVKKILTKIIF